MMAIRRLGQLALPVGAGLALAAALLLGLRQAAAELGLGSAPLGAGANPFEVNVDDNDHLWISEFGAGRVRQVNPATGAYTVYAGLTGALDAKPDAAGRLWWAGYSRRTLGWLDPATGAAVVYTLTTGRPWSFDFDASGTLWIMDEGASATSLTTFDPATATECSVPLPNAGHGSHNRYNAGAVWVSDYAANAILRITPTTLALTSWTISTTTATPYDLAFEADGTVWFAAYGLKRVARLEPSTNEISLYGPDDLAGPVAVALQGDRVWYTDYLSGSVGYVDPGAAAAAGAWTVTPTVGTLTPACFTNSAVQTYTVGIVTGTLAFPPLAVTGVPNSGGARYFISAASRPWDLSVQGDTLWITDSGLHALHRLGNLERVFLPLIAK